MRIYRIEHLVNEHGMWYNHKGEYSPVVLELLSNDTLLRLNMSRDSKHQYNGHNWFTGCLNKEIFMKWFNTKDLEQLMDNNYRIYELESSQFVIEETQVLYTVEGLRTKVELTLEEVSTVSDPVTSDFTEQSWA